MYSIPLHQSSVFRFWKKNFEARIKNNLQHLQYFKWYFRLFSGLISPSFTFRGSWQFSSGHFPTRLHRPHRLPTKPPISSFSSSDVHETRDKISVRVTGRCSWSVGRYEYYMLVFMVLKTVRVSNMRCYLLFFFFFANYDFVITKKQHREKPYITKTERRKLLLMIYVYWWSHWIVVTNFSGSF